MCNFVCGTMPQSKFVIALDNFTLSVDFCVIFWAWLGKVFYAKMTQIKYEAFCGF